METDLEPIEQPEKVEIDADRQRQAREYASAHRRLLVLKLLLSTLGIIFIFLTGMDTWFRDILAPVNWQPIAGWYPLQVLCYLVALLLAYEVITLPFSYYSSYLLPGRYGLSTMKLAAWVGDRFKGLGLSLIFEVIVVEVIYLLLATQPLWWLWVALILLFFSVVLANLAPVLIMPIFYKFSPLPEGELKQRLLALMQRANTRVNGVFTMHLSDKTTAANAALMGLGNTRRVVLGDTMIDRYTIDEIEVVLAHELGHHLHRDIWKLIISQSLFTLGGLYLFDVVMHWFVDTQGHFSGISDPATLPLLLTLTGVFSMVLMPLTNGYSRLIEYQADEYALRATGKIEPFKSAMTRLANQNLSEVDPSPVYEFLFYDHPTIGKRLKHADAFAARQR